MSKLVAQDKVMLGKRRKAEIPSLQREAAICKLFGARVTTAIAAHLLHTRQKQTTSEKGKR